VKPDSIVRYLTVSELIFINGTLLNDPQIISGKQKVRDIDLLEAAVLRPMASAFGQDAYPTLRQKAAALLHSLARNHPFKDGNKRTATVGLVFMLDVNGERISWEPAAALEWILKTAQGGGDVHTLADWLVLKPTAPSPEPDLERDTRTIQRIIQEHEWLLAELAKQ